ncbi:DNA-processing protein DprA [Sulfurovum sp. bin170]|uniref:DNA-processing protein DprA n=1 Tax=Sulfurovum sp. bin170 TaxID=2695268 RepID=UPI0013DEC5AE|nr:DNA-processing protein DprA [Sulfurovum sp. bin170]NEW59895.1 DNA-processing protein DprA [Sulfurovum sp. bin170]
MELIEESISALEDMKKYPKELYSIGDRGLLKRAKVSMVGTRRPSNYTKQFTYTLAKALSSRGVCIVSGGAMGVDAISHNGAGVENTIAVVANSLDVRYPAVNRSLIEQIEQRGLMLSQFSPTFKATPWSFVVRNELVVALGSALIVTEADEGSGSMRSVEFALKMGREIFVLPHRLGESMGTNQLLAQGLAKPIYDIETFANSYGVVPKDDAIEKDEFFYFCQTSPTFDEAIAKFSTRVYEAELEGLIAIENGLIRLV